MLNGPVLNGPGPDSAVPDGPGPDSAVPDGPVLNGPVPDGLLDVAALDGGVLAEVLAVVAGAEVPATVERGPETVAETVVAAGASVGGPGRTEGGGVLDASISPAVGPSAVAPGAGPIPARRLAGSTLALPDRSATA